MNQRNFSSVVGVVFALIALVHLARIFYGWDAVINNWNVPMAASWATVLVAGYLGYQGFKFSKGS